MEFRNLFALNAIKTFTYMLKLFQSKTRYNQCSEFRTAILFLNVAIFLASLRNPYRNLESRRCTSFIAYALDVVVYRVATHNQLTRNSDLALALCQQQCNLAFSVG